MEGKEGIYLLARETSEIENLKRFSQKIAEHFDESFLLRNPFWSWDAFFEYLARIDGRFVVAIDEFPYLVKANPALLSILQEYWNAKLSDTKLLLITCGSSVSMMEKLLGYKSPIYGRRMVQLRLNLLDFSKLGVSSPTTTGRNWLRFTGCWEGILHIYSTLKIDSVSSRTS